MRDRLELSTTEEEENKWYTRTWYVDSLHKFLHKIEREDRNSMASLTYNHIIFRDLYIL
jgi:hypothetical protein